nr:hypothetical protein [Tanacetum cinerariifolium]
MEAKFVALDKATKKAEWLISFLEGVPVIQSPKTNVSGSGSSRSKWFTRDMIRSMKPSKHVEPKAVSKFNPNIGDVVKSGVDIVTNKASGGDVLTNKASGNSVKDKASIVVKDKDKVPTVVKNKAPAIVNDKALIDLSKDKPKANLPKDKPKGKPNSKYEASDRKENKLKSEGGLKRKRNASDSKRKTIPSSLFSAIHDSRVDMVKFLTEIVTYMSALDNGKSIEATHLKIHEILGIPVSRYPSSKLLKTKSVQYLGPYTFLVLLYLDTTRSLNFMKSMFKFSRKPILFNDDDDDGCLEDCGNDIDGNDDDDEGNNVNVDEEVNDKDPSSNDVGLDFNKGNLLDEKVERMEVMNPGPLTPERMTTRASNVSPSPEKQMEKASSYLLSPYMNNKTKPVPKLQGCSFSLETMCLQCMATRYNSDSGATYDSKYKEACEVLRFKYATKILLHELNVHAKKMLELAKVFDKVDSREKMSIIVEAIRNKEQHECS